MLDQAGVPVLIHQPRYNIFDRWIIEDDPDSDEPFLDMVDRQGVGLITFSPLAQGLLTNKYLNDIPRDSRAAKDHGFLQQSAIDEPTISAIKQLHYLAEQRGQSLAQMALSWGLRHSQVCSTVIGASRISQLQDNMLSLNNLEWSTEELQRVDAICMERNAAKH